MSSSRTETAKTKEDVLDERLREALDDRLNDAPSDRLKARLRAAKTKASQSGDSTPPRTQKP